jgi:hypothetical protein
MRQNLWQTLVAMMAVLTVLSDCQFWNFLASTDLGGQIGYNPVPHLWNRCKKFLCNAITKKLNEIVLFLLRSSVVNIFDMRPPQPEMVV